MRKVLVIGAGFSGLTAAFYLNRAGFEVEVLESAEKVGGLLSTLETSHGLVETAANGLLNSALVEDLFESVGVPLVGTVPSARRRFIFRDGRFRRWPLGISGTFRVAWFLIRYLFTKTSVTPLKGESVTVWSTRVLGREAAEFLVEPALQGIYAGDSTRLSAQLILSRFFAKRENKSANLPKHPRLRGSVSAPRGMGQLMSALETYLRNQGVQIHTNRGVSPEHDTDFVQTVARSNPVVVATNPVSAASLLASSRPLDAELLAKIELSPIVTTTAFFNSTDLRSKGFGVLFPRVETRRMLGVLKNNFIFHGRADRTYSETWMMGGATPEGKRVLDLKKDESVVSLICEEREHVFGISEKPESAVVTRWPKGIPHYTLALADVIPLLERMDGNILLHGNYLGDLGLAKILERSKRLAERITSEGQWV